MKKTVLILALGAASLSLSACDVKKTQDGKMPEVNATGGQMPKYDVDAADVDANVGTTTKTVEVPTADVDVTSPDATQTPNAE